MKYLSLIAFNPNFPLFSYIFSDLSLMSRTLSSQNDLGQKAWEVCVVRGHEACAEYLCVHEAGLALATDLTRREAELEAATSDNTDLRISFK